MKIYKIKNRLLYSMGDMTQDGHDFRTYGILGIIYKLGYFYIFGRQMEKVEYEGKYIYGKN